jgi:hypothetical protein
MNLNNLPQRIFRRHEIPIADYLMGFQQALKNDFLEPLKMFGNDCSLNYATNIIMPSMQDRKDISDELSSYMVQHTNSTPNREMWRVKDLKYSNETIGKYFIENDPETVKTYSTAMKLIDEYGEDCLIAGYSLLGPNSKINRHTDVENRSSEFIRIHIPLIVPKGEVYFEVFGERVTWDDIFAFNNQFVHSAHNNTPDWRLCFVIDIRRTRIGLPPGVHYKEIQYLDELNHC